MPRIGPSLAITAAAALLAWYYWLGLTTMPGQINDDVIYLTLGKALATGQGYRDLYLVGAPPHVGYPPLYPLALAGVWRLFPEFPANLLAFKALNIGFALATLALMAVLARRTLGLPAWQAGLAVATYAFGNVVVLANDLTMSEAMFGTVLVAALVGIERLAEPDRAPRAWHAPAIAAFAVVPFLTRTVGLSVPVGAVLWLLATGRRKLALLVAAWAAAWYAPWFLYVRQARAAAASFDYVGWTASHTGGFDPGVLLATTASHVPEVLLRSIPQAVAPVPAHGALAAAAALVTLAGLLRLAGPGVRLLHLVLLAYFALVLPFPWDTGRYVAALAPVLVVAFVHGAAWPAEAARRAGLRPGPRAAAIALSAVILLAGLGGAKRVVGFARRDAHHDALLAPGQRVLLDDYRAIAAWARGRLPADAMWVSHRAALWYLWTGHPAVGYLRGADPPPEVAALWRTHDAYAVHPTRPTFAWGLGELLAAHPGKAELVYTSPGGTFQVYRLARDW